MKLLSKSHENLIRTEIKKYQEYEKAFVFPNGWESTCVSEPSEGGIDKDIENGEILEFTDKYRNQHVGIVSGLWFEKSTKSLFITVVCYESLLSKELTFINYGMNAKKSNDPRIKQMLKDKQLVSQLIDYCKK